MTSITISGNSNDTDVVLSSANASITENVDPKTVNPQDVSALTLDQITTLIESKLSQHVSNISDVDKLKIMCKDTFYYGKFYDNKIPFASLASLNLSKPSFMDGTEKFISDVNQYLVDTPSQINTLWHNTWYEVNGKWLYDLKVKDGKDPRDGITTMDPGYFDYDNSIGKLPTKIPITNFYSSGKIAGAIAAKIPIDREMYSLDTELYRIIPSMRKMLPPPDQPDASLVEQPVPLKVVRMINAQNCYSNPNVPIYTLSGDEYVDSGVVNGPLNLGLASYFPNPLTIDGITVIRHDRAYGTGYEFTVELSNLTTSEADSIRNNLLTPLSSSIGSYQVTLLGYTQTFYQIPTNIVAQGGAYDPTTGRFVTTAGTTLADATFANGSRPFSFTTRPQIVTLSIPGQIQNNTITYTDTDGNSVTLTKADMAQYSLNDLFTIIPQDQWKTTADIPIPGPDFNYSQYSANGNDFLTPIELNAYYQQYFEENNVPYFNYLGTPLPVLIFVDDQIAKATLSASAYDSVTQSDTVLRQTQIDNAPWVKAKDVHPFSDVSGFVQVKPLYDKEISIGGVGFYYYEEDAKKYPTVRDALTLSSGFQRALTSSGAQNFPNQLVISNKVNNNVRLAFPNLNDASKYAPGTGPSTNIENDIDNVLDYNNEITSNLPLWDVLFQTGLLADQPGTVFRYATDCEIWECMFTHAYNKFYDLNLTPQEIIEREVFDVLDMKDTFFKCPVDHPDFADRLSRYIPRIEYDYQNSVHNRQFLNIDGSGVYTPKVENYTWDASSSTWVYAYRPWNVLADLGNVFMTKAKTNSSAGNNAWSFRNIQGIFSTVEDWSKILRMIKDGGKYIDNSGVEQRMLTTPLLELASLCQGPPIKTQLEQFRYGTLLGGNTVGLTGWQYNASQKVWGLGAQAVGNARIVNSTPGSAYYREFEEDLIYNRNKNSGVINNAAYQDPYIFPGASNYDQIQLTLNGRYSTNGAVTWGGFGGKVWVVDPKAGFTKMTSTNVGNASNDALGNIFTADLFDFIL